mgnify:FL=1
MPSGSLYQFENVKPKIPSTCFVAPGAHIIGKVFLGEHVNVWFNCILRGDENEIHVGENTNVQDLSILHNTKWNALIIGKNVTIGHHVVLHGCTIEDHCLIGMGAIILDGAVIGEGSVVAAGSVVPPRKTYPPKSLIMGSPAKFQRELTADEATQYNNHYKGYLINKDQYLDPSIYCSI